jgi:hypothetical protein
MTKRLNFKKFMQELLDPLEIINIANRFVTPAEDSPRSFRFKFTQRDLRAFIEAILVRATKIHGPEYPSSYYRSAAANDSEYRVGSRSTGRSKAAIRNYRGGEINATNTYR